MPETLPPRCAAVLRSRLRKCRSALSLWRLARSLPRLRHQADYPVKPRHSDPGGEVITTVRAVPWNATVVAVVAGDDVVENPRVMALEPVDEPVNGSERR